MAKRDTRKNKKMERKNRKETRKQDGGKRKGTRKMNPWAELVTKTYREMKKRNPDAKLRDAMKEAKKQYKK